MSALEVIAVDSNEVIVGSVESPKPNPLLPGEVDLSAENFFRSRFPERFKVDYSRREERMTLRAVLAEHAAQGLDNLVRNALGFFIDRSPNLGVKEARDELLTSVGGLIESLKERNWDLALRQFLDIEVNVKKLISSMQADPNLEAHIQHYTIGKNRREQVINSYLDTIMDRLAGIHSDAEVLNGERPEESAPILIN